MNSQVSHVTGFSPYEMVYHQTHLIVYQKGDIVKDPHEIHPISSQNCSRGGVGWGGVGWVMQGWGGVG